MLLSEFADKSKIQFKGLFVQKNVFYEAKTQNVRTKGIMRILFYINAIHQGGAERVMVNLANQFSEKGNDVILVTSFEDYWEYPVGEGVERYSFEDRDFKKEGFLRQNVKWTLNLRKVIKEYCPDVVISFMAEPNF